MGAVYGRMNFKRFSHHTSCSPSHSKPQASSEVVGSGRRLREREASSSASASPAPVSRRATRRQSSHRPATLRRSARINAPTGSMMVRGPLRRSARLARVVPKAPRVIHRESQARARRPAPSSSAASPVDLLSRSLRSEPTGRNHGQMIPSLSRPVTRQMLRNQLV